MVKVAFLFFRSGRAAFKTTLSVVFSSLIFVLTVPEYASAASGALPRATVRLLPAPLNQGTGIVGVEIAMEAGVKTYWRMPGDSGLPPIFNWSTSDNLKTARVEWPLPERIADPAGSVLGYHDTVVFPVSIEAIDPSKPVRLSLALDYAVCGEVCVPLKAEVEAMLDAKPVDPTITDAIEHFRARVPAASVLGGPTKPALIGITPAGPDQLTVSTDTPVHDLIIEGPDGWYFGDATPSREAEWQVKILERPSKAQLAGLALTVTLIGRLQSTETRVTLDPSGAIR
jgi:DsbC/DsbD-like thiol-disulfide interchange protein